MLVHIKARSLQKYFSPKTNIVDSHGFHCRSGSSILDQCVSGSDTDSGIDNFTIGKKFLFWVKPFEPDRPPDGTVSDSGNILHIC